MSEKALTRDEILEMKPGEDLDVLVIGRVMGWRVFGSKINKDGYIAYLADFRPSSDISAAWEAWQKVQRDHVHMSIHWMDGKYLAEIIEMDPEEGYKYLSQVECDTAPEAICKATFLAVMDL